MPRDLSSMTPRELRARDECGLHESAKRIWAARLLDECDQSKSLEDIKAVISKLITHVTGVQ